MSPSSDYLSSEQCDGKLCLQVVQIEKAAHQLENLIARNARVAQGQDEYQRAFDVAHQNHQSLLESHGVLHVQIQDKKHRLAAYSYFKQS